MLTSILEYRTCASHPIRFGVQISFSIAGMAPSECLCVWECLIPLYCVCVCENVLFHFTMFVFVCVRMSYSTYHVCGCVCANVLFHFAMFVVVCSCICMCVSFPHVFVCVHMSTQVCMSTPLHPPTPPPLCLAHHGRLIHATW